VRWCVLWLVCGCDQLLGLTTIQQVPDAAPDAPDAALADASIDLGAGLVASYSFDTLPASGPCLVDDTGHGHDGTCSVPPTLVAGKHGMAFSLAPGPIDIEVADAPDLDGAAGLTVAVWLQITNDPADFECAINRPFLDSDADFWQICVQPAHVYVVIGGAAISAQPMPLNEWHHVALTWDGAVGSLYVDGLLQSATRTTMDLADQPIAIGVDKDYLMPLAVPYPGMLDELRIYNRALDAAEMALLAQ
jgi:hypothetical protein